MTSVSKTNCLGFALLLGAAVFMPAPAPAQSPDEARAICNDPSLQQRLITQVEESHRRVALELQIEALCAQIDLPSTPIHEAVDASPEASHADWTLDARYSPDGRTIVSASRDGTVRFWDAETGKPIRRIVAAEEYRSGDQTEKGTVNSVTFVGDGSLVAAASTDNQVRLIDVATGEIVASLAVATERPLDFPGEIAATTGGLLFIGGFKADVDAIDAGTRAVRYRLPGHLAEATAIAVSEAADLVATAASSAFAEPEMPPNPRVQLWRLSTGEKLAEFVPEGDPRPSKLAFSHDGAELAIVSGGFVHIYSVADKRIAKTISVHPVSSPFDVAFTADGKGLITCTTHPVLWDLATAQRVRHFGPFTDLCHSVDVSPDGRFAVTTSMSSELRIWEVATGTFYRRLGGNAPTQR